MASLSKFDKPIFEANPTLVKTIKSTTVSTTLIKMVFHSMTKRFKSE